VPRLVALLTSLGLAICKMPFSDRG
jgi:hypothetical protein